MSSERLPRTSPSHGLLDASASPSASRIAACHRHTPTEEGTVTLQSSKVSAFPWTVVLHHPRARRGKCPRSQRRTCPPTASTLTPLLSTLDRPVLTDLKSLSYSTEGGGLQPHQAPLSSAPGPPFFLLLDGPRVRPRLVSEQKGRKRRESDLSATSGNHCAERVERVERVERGAGSSGGWPNEHAPETRRGPLCHPPSCGLI